MTRLAFLLSGVCVLPVLACSPGSGDGAGGGGTPGVGGAPSGGSPGSGGASSGGAAPGVGGASGGSATGGAADGGSGGSLASGGSGASSSAGGSSSGGGTGGEGTGGAGTGGSTSGDCSGLPICDDFEDDSVGMAPASSGWALEYGWNPVLEAGEEAHIVVSDEDASSPSKSVRVSSTAGGGGGSDPWSFAFENPGETFYARAFIHVTDLGGGNATLMAVGPDHNNEIRLRFHEGTITLNSAGGGDGLNPDPSVCTECLDQIVGSWFCAEMFYDGATDTARLWINDMLAAEVVQNGGWHSSGQFPENSTRVWFGVLGHNGGAPVAYFDDVAVGPEPIGCD